MLLPYRQPVLTTLKVTGAAPRCWQQGHRHTARDLSLLEHLSHNRHHLFYTHYR
jgi:hypothetical protein